MIEKNVKKFVQIYDTDLNSVYRFCYVKTRDNELAKDIAQQSFLKAWVYVRTETKKINVRALVYKIATNLIIDWYRKKKESSLDALVDEGFDPQSDMQTDIEANWSSTSKILDELSDDERDIILLRYVNGLKPKEIAEIIGESVNVTSVRIHRAKVKLRKVIDTKNYELF